MSVPRGWVVLLIGLSAAVALGGAGTWAFNPENGAWFHSKPLWRIFGIAEEGGLLLIALLVVLAAVAGALALVWMATRRLIR